MQKILIIMILPFVPRFLYHKQIIFTLLLLVCFLNLLSQPAKDIIEISEQILLNLEDNKFKKIVKHFDNNLSEKLPSEDLENLWNDLNKQLGVFKKSSNIRTKLTQKYQIVFTTCIFEKMSIDMKLIFDSEGLVTGFFFVPSKSSAAYKDPEYIKFDSIIERKIQIKTGEYILPGAVTLPNHGNKFPVVILVHGSGPNDRDESIGPNKPFRDLALGLASNGIGVIRYDKRTKVYATEMAKYVDSITVMQETIEDALSAIHKAKNMSEIDTGKIYLLGHSLGGMLAPRIAKLYPNLAGIIIMAGNARPLEDLILEQMNYILSLDEISEDDKQELNKIEIQVKNVKSMDSSKQVASSKLPLNISYNYWMDLKNYDQTDIAKNLKNKILILQGERDYQVTMDDYKIWQEELSDNESVRFISYPKLNHLFMEGEGNSTPAEYEKQKNIPDYVIYDIANWLKSH